MHVFPRLCSSSLRFILLLSVVGLILFGCEEAATDEEGGEGGAVVIAYQEWQDAVVSANVAKVILEQHGFSVTLSAMGNTETWAAVANGSADAMLSAWLPVTHSSQWNAYQDSLVDVGVTYEVARLGLVVPSYSEANSIADLNTNAGDFNAEIQGIDPGAGMMDTTQSMINSDTYSLGNWNLIEASGPEMLTALGNAIDSNEEIVVTGWTPHSMFANYELTFLEDPQGVYGQPEQVKTLVRQGLESEKGGAYAFFDEFDWTQLNLLEVMADLAEGASASQAAEAFVTANQSTIDSLLPDHPAFR